ncbi:hypothetical protein [Vibrio minamisatsumaniensis]|uniref:hypothetical protein n=1 Tax=Vibrio minamisatsumaniensis TaxID=2910243 RepID=UPI003D1C8488
MKHLFIAVLILLSFNAQADKTGLEHCEEVSKYIANEKGLDYKWVKNASSGYGGSVQCQTLFTKPHVHYGFIEVELYIEYNFKNGAIQYRQTR